MVDETSQTRTGKGFKEKVIDIIGAKVAKSCYIIWY